MSNKAVSYAEDTLGVHLAHRIASGQLQTLDETLSELDKALDRKRHLTEKIADREAEHLGEMRAVHHKLSDTAFKTHLKTWQQEDDTLRELRGQMNEVLGEIQGLDIDAEMARTRIRVATARMNELGGYLFYLGVVKQADIANKSTSREESTE